MSSSVPMRTRRWSARPRPRRAETTKEYPMPIDPAKVAAIDVHVHAEVSCHDPEDPVMAEFFDAASTYFKADRKRPTIPETIAYYREKNIAFCLFTVDAECGMGAKRISNYEVAEIAAQHDDIVIPFASIDPHK